MLTKTLILSRFSKKSDLSEITKLNIYAENIEDISILSSMPKLEYLSLSSNNISSLSALSDCIYLREIYLRNNNISSFEELNHLRYLFNLKVLWLEGNPICDASAGCEYIYSNNIKCNKCADVFYEDKYGTCSLCIDEIPNCGKCHYNNQTQNVICDSCVDSIYILNKINNTCNELNDCDDEK